MNNVDLRLIESLDGGDYVLKGNDLQLISGFQNMPYIGLFGGNKQPTTGPKTTEQTFDFWGNYLFYPTDSSKWINSITEHLLEATELNSASRIKIEQSVMKDLQFMLEFAEIKVSVVLIDVDKLKITIEIHEPNVLNSTVFTYIWNATEQELMMEDSIGTQNGNGVALDIPLNFGL
jgi:Fe-S cluster assembly iron-binding protein IscA